MKQPSKKSRDSPDDFIVEIVEVLKQHGLDPKEYQLQEHVDVDALERLVTSSNEDVEVRFHIQGVPVSVTPDRITIPSDESSTTDQHLE